MGFRRRRFGTPRRPARPPVEAINTIRKGKRGKCDACNGYIEVGDTYVKLKLGKRYATPCPTCTLQPKTSRRFHTHCVPADINAAMHFDPVVWANRNSWAPPPPAAAAAPPPKPKGYGELCLESLVVLEAALIAKAKERGLTEEMKTAFKTYQGIKARVLRPGTPAEGEVATSIAIQRLVKLVFN